MNTNDKRHDRLDDAQRMVSLQLKNGCGGAGPSNSRPYGAQRVRLACPAGPERRRRRRCRRRLPRLPRPPRVAAVALSWWACACRRVRLRSSTLSVPSSALAPRVLPSKAKASHLEIALHQFRYRYHCQRPYSIVINVRLTYASSKFRAPMLQAWPPGTRPAVSGSLLQVHPSHPSLHHRRLRRRRRRRRQRYGGRRAEWPAAGVLYPSLRRQRRQRRQLRLLLRRRQLPPPRQRRRQQRGQAILHPRGGG